MHGVIGCGVGGGFPESMPREWPATVVAGHEEGLTQRVRVARHLGE